MPLNARLQDWSGKRVWIIGASAGIGASLARALGQRGARVALSARDREALAIVATGLSPENTAILPLDITRPAEIYAAKEVLLQVWTGIDLIVVMAGDYQPMGAWNLDLERADALLAVNLHGPLNVLDAVLPALRQQGEGGVVLVSSVAGYRGLPLSLVYGPSKAALINLAESLYLDLHPKGLSVYLVNPGFVRTRLTAVNDFEMPALISADEAAAEIMEGLARGDFEIHFPRRFTRLLKLLRLLPYRWYFPLILRKTQS